ncbi:hypothetical protein GCM10009560_16060 [Nonomuraea longicatena]|uniref:Transposase n=1 Tax=Nonomuraea longicatena TaxID=83682 RepID=A0ABP3ZB41_9ACTN
MASLASKFYTFCPALRARLVDVQQIGQIARHRQGLSGFDPGELGTAPRSPKGAKPGDRIGKRQVSIGAQSSKKLSKVTSAQGRADALHPGIFHAGDEPVTGFSHIFM